MFPRGKIGHFRLAAARLPRCMIWILLAAGCQTMSPSLVSCPWSAVEQARKIDEIVPPGSTREEAVSRLKKAGIAGNFGEADSIYYCDIWNRDDSERWHINVALLFDEEGKLYALRPDPHGKSTAGQSLPAANVKKRSDAAESHGGPGDPGDPFTE
jgi:hypothetical protein